MSEIEPSIIKLGGVHAGELGEAIALAKLNSLGYLAYLSPAGAPGHDLIVMVGERALSVEVKTRQFIRRESEITRWPLLMKTKGKADLFLLIAIDLKIMTPKFYLLTNAQVQEIHRATPLLKGSGSLMPKAVRETVEANDFSALARL